jgi:hypothetical protein
MPKKLIEEIENKNIQFKRDEKDLRKLGLTCQILELSHRFH